MINLRAQNNIDLNAHANVTMKADRDLDFKAVSTASTDAGVSLLLKSAAGTVVQAMAPLDLYGSLIRMNGGTKPAIVGSQVQLLPNSTGQIVSGSSTILSKD